MTRDPFERTDYGVQAAGYAPLGVVLGVWLWAWWNTWWSVLPAAGLGLVLPALGFCLVRVVRR
jgi:hypothetical protein